MTRPAAIRCLIAMFAITLAPSIALACPVCFGQNDSALAVAMNNGVLMMLGVVVAVLGCFAVFIGYLVRRARLAAEPVDSTEYRTTSPQEGTV